MERKKNKLVEFPIDGGVAFIDPDSINSIYDRSPYPTEKGIILSNLTLKDNPSPYLLRITAKEAIALCDGDLTMSLKPKT